MPVRNLWSFEPGECLVAEEVSKRLRCEVYFPLRDVGVDLLLVRGNRHVGIQVKESRYYRSRKWKSGDVGHSWHQVKERKFRESKGKVGFYVFVTYEPVEAEHKLRFKPRYLIVPSPELERRMSAKDPGAKRIYSFCFHFEENRVTDERVKKNVDLDDERVNYNPFLEAWDLIERSL